MTRHTSRGGRAAAAVLVAALLGGCGGGGGGSAGAPPTADGPGASTSATPAAPPLDAGADTPVEDSASPTWDAESAKTAAAAGTAAVKAFIRKDLDDAAWWAAVTPKLSAMAVADYTGTAPANVPGQRVTGTAEASSGPSPYLAAVVVPTDAGDYAVLLSRDPNSTLPNPWLVEHFGLPPGS